MSSNDISTITTELRALQSVKLAGDSNVKDEMFRDVLLQLQNYDNPINFSDFGAVAQNMSPFERFRREYGSRDNHALWRSWKECQRKSELQQSYAQICEGQYTMLREKYSNLQSREYIPVLMRLAFSCWGFYGEWGEQNFEAIKSMEYFGRCPGINAELTEAQLTTQLNQTKYPNDIYIQRTRLLRRVLCKPISTDSTASESELYSLARECQTKFREQSVLMYEYCTGVIEHEESGDDSEEDTEDQCEDGQSEEKEGKTRPDVETRLRVECGEDQDKWSRIQAMYTKSAAVRSEENVRLHALSALLPQLTELTLPQAKWLVYALLFTDDENGRNCLEMTLPPVMVQALVCLFQEQEYLYNSNGAISVRMAAAARLGRCAIEDPDENKRVVVAAFNMALLKIANKLPGIDGSYSHVFMNPDEVAMLLDIICDMQANGCVKEVSRMWKQTGGRMVNQAVSRFGAGGGQGVLDFLACMGATAALPPIPLSLNPAPGGNTGNRGSRLVESVSARSIEEERVAAAAMREALFADQKKEKNGKSDSVCCGACGAVKTIKEMKRCSRCAAVSYCDSNCQKKDWKIHKNTCKPK
jgi:hypothetical protein